MPNLRRSATPPIREPLRVSVGRLIDRLGQNGLGLGIGIVVGFWAADFGTPWLPTMLEILAFYFALSLLFLLGGTWLQGRGVRDTEVGLKLRKRIAVGMVLVLGAIVLRLAAHWIGDPGTLAGLTGDELARVFDRDARQVASLDAQLEVLLEGLEEHDLTPAGVALAESQRQLLRDSWRGVLDAAFALDLVRRRYATWYDIGYSRRRRPLFLRHFLLATTAELALHEKALRLARRFDDAPEAATFLDAGLPLLDIPPGTVTRLLTTFAGPDATTRLAATEGYLAWLREAFGERELVAARRGEVLLGRIARYSGVIRNLSRGATPPAEGGDAPNPQILRRPIPMEWLPHQERFAELLEAGSGRQALEAQRVSDEQLADLGAVLVPGDILVGRRQAALDAVAIPGYWASASLYLGSPEDLAARFDGAEARARISALPGPGVTLGEHLERTYPVAWSRYRAGDPEEPLAVLVADPSGVHLTTLRDAVADTVAVLRLELPPASVAAALAAAFEHLDAPYDFAFDFATEHAVSGTELVWRAYGGSAGLGIEPVPDAGRTILPADALVAAWAAGAGTASDATAATETRPDATAAEVTADAVTAADATTADATTADITAQPLTLVYFLDLRPAENRAVSAGPEVLRQTLGRGKWWTGDE